LTQFFFPSQLKAKKTIRDDQGRLSIDRRRELHSAVLNSIVRDARSFDDFNKPGMRDFLAIAIPHYKPPHRTTIRRNLAALYAEHRNTLRTTLPTLPWIALTTDVWKSARRIYFICITAHCFNNQFEIFPLVIGFRRLAGRHLAPRLRSYIQYELDSLGIDKVRISAITTDNGSDIKAATAYGFGERISCLAHNINLCVSNGLSLWRKPNPKK
jgi:zinc finger BED domain-containing protein 1 (E3 SUMO-protein ligase ZBED1)